jgi:hypothetical protein
LVSESLVVQYADQDFSGLSAFDGPDEVADHEFRRCQFFNVCASPRPTPASRLFIRRVSLVRCTHWNCSLFGAALEDIHVENLKRKGRSPLFLWDCAFRRVTLRGPISFPKLNAHVALERDSPRSKAFRAANVAFYAETDWALDISGAQFGGFVDFPGIPPSLIRRDPTSQFVMLRSLAPRFLEPSYPRDVWSLVATEALAGTDDGVTVALGTRAKTFQRDRQRATQLRTAGLLV